MSTAGAGSAARPPALCRRRTARLSTSTAIHASMPPPANSLKGDGVSVDS